MKHGAYATPLNLAVRIPRTFEDKRMMPIVVEGVSSTQSLIHQCGQTKVIGQLDSDVQRRIFVAPHAVMHPVENEFTGSGRGRFQNPATLHQPGRHGGQDFVGGHGRILCLTGKPCRAGA